MNAPPEFVYFTDRDLGRRFAQALRAAGFAVEAHDEHFGPTTLDQEWLPTVARRGWIVLTHDQRLRYESPAVAAAMRANARVVVIIAKGLRHDQLAELVLENRRRVERFLRRHKAPFLAKLRRDSVELWLSHQQWLERLI